MASRGGYNTGFNDSFRNGTRRYDNSRENTSQQGLNARQTELARSGRVPNRYSNSGGNSRSSYPGVMQEYRIVKDKRTKQKEASGTVPEVDNNGECSIQHTASSVGGKSSTEKLAALDSLVTGNGNGHGAAQADTCIKSADLAHDKEASNVRKMEQSGGMKALVGSHEVLGKGIQNRDVTVTPGKNSFAGELCCSSSDPIHVPSPGSKSAGTFGAIKREVGVVGARQRPSDKSGTNTSTSNGLVKVASTPKDNPSNEQSGLPGSSLKNGRINVPVPLNRPFPSSQYHHKPQNHVSQTKASAHLEWKPKSISPSSTNHEVSVSSSGAPSPVDGNQVAVAVLSKKLSQANVSRNEQVIIPEHLRVPDFKRTHLIFGTFESEVSDTSGATPDTVVTKECLNDHSPSSLTALNAMVSTDISPNDKMDHAVFQSSLPQSSDTNTSVSEHQKSSSGAVEVPSPGVVGEYATEMISSKVMHSQPQFQHQDNQVVPNYKKYEPDSRYGAPFMTKAVDDEAAESIVYPSEVLGLHPAHVNQLAAATQQPVPQMYPQQFQVPQYPNFLPYRHVYPPHYVPPVVVPNYSSNPAFPQLPHASSYLVMPNGTSQLAANGMKYGLPHQYKQVFPGTPTGYGGYANHNGYTVSAGVIGSTGHVEDVSMSKYKDNNLYPPNLQSETADVWVQGHREIPNMPNMPSAPLYNVMGQPMSPHAAYLPSQNSHAAFTPAPPHPGHLQYPGFPHTLQPTSMTMVQNPQSMVHQAAVPQLAGNVGLDMATIAPGSQVAAFQQSQFGHLGWAPPNY